MKRIVFLALALVAGGWSATARADCVEGCESFCRAMDHRATPVAECVADCVANECPDGGDGVEPTPPTPAPDGTP
ncbi:MAG: hypothetical protein HY905_02860 [Deltaproteobacteria bacterium]|nr:hypothetical protein [Deltaproteobacteria bacterium]